MKITFYGVRGSIPSPGPATARFGGNTPCVHIQLENEKDVIFDAGTGIRNLGHILKRSITPIYLIVGHSHWDHIQGYPYFEPIFQPGRNIFVFPGNSDTHTRLCDVFDQLDGSHFPILAAELPSHAECITENPEIALARHGINVTRKRLNHPGGGYAYRLEEDGSSVAYITDNELYPPGKTTTPYEEWVSFCKGVSVLIHDAQYTESDMPQKQGWGHSIVSQVRQFAIDAGVETLVLFHHDPDRSDTELEQIQVQTNAYFRGKNSPIKSLCAWEGLELELK